MSYLDCSAKDDQRDAANSKEDSRRSLRIGSRTEHRYRKYSLSAAVFGKEFSALEMKSQRELTGISRVILQTCPESDHPG